MAISVPSVNMLCFSTVRLLCCSIHVPQAAITNRLPQHLPAVHHGEHETDHPQWLYHFPADASHPSTWHGPWLVTTGTACHNPLCTWSSRYGPSPAKSPAGERLWVGRDCSLQTVCSWSSGYLFQTPRSKWPSQILLICSLHWGCNWFGCCSISLWFMVFPFCRVVAF